MDFEPVCAREAKISPTYRGSGSSENLWNILFILFP
jgi:hypothetical protein